VRAMVTVGPQRMELCDIEEPLIGSDEAEVRVETVGLCAADLHMYLGDSPVAHYPHIQGHEFAGIVERLSPHYSGPARIGDRVAVEPLRPCGTCYACRRGRPNCCANLIVVGAHVPGALAERITVRHNALYPTGNLDRELAALVEPISIGLQAVTRGGVSRDEQVVVFGAGPIGQAVMIGAADRGARVLVVDRVAARLDLARALGAELTVDATVEPAIETILAWTGGDGAAVAIEATGSPTVVRTCVDAVAHSGRIVVVGISTQEIAIPMLEMTRKELTVLGSRNNAGLFGDAVALVQRNQERARRLITHRFPLELTAQAIEFTLAHPSEAEKVLISIGGVV